MIPVPDLLVIGGVSVDRFADGSRRPGGAVYHGIRAAVGWGASVASIVLAGPEPEARTALAELHAAGPCRLHDARRSTGFAIEEQGAHRRIVLERRGGSLAPGLPEIASFAARAVLFAPIAAEIPARSVVAPIGMVRVAGLQGWLRLLRVGRVVRPRALASLPATLVSALSRFDALTASADDVEGADGRPLVALASLRRSFGEKPLIFVTAGAAGAWLDLHGAARLHVAPPHVVHDVGTVGAGDAFAAILAASLGRRLDPETAAQRAASAVADLLAARRT